MLFSVDGSWGEWQQWEMCSKSCGSGEKVRSRECNHPLPQHGGQPCHGVSMEKMVCNVASCPGNMTYYL